MHTSVLAVYPHPDDETFGNGGALALHASQGAKVTLVCSTLGQMGRNMGKPFFATRESLPEIREHELRSACRELGISDVRLLGLRDKMVEFEDESFVSELILRVILDVNPTLIYTYYPRHGVHPDHDAMSAATIRAVLQVDESKRPIIYGSAITRDHLSVLGPPDVELDVSPVIERKVAAIKAHRSQSGVMMSKLDSEDELDVRQRQLVKSQFRKEFYWIYKV